jgi:hypothetical protein
MICTNENVSSGIRRINAMCCFTKLNCLSGSAKKVLVVITKMFYFYKNIPLHPDKVSIPTICLKYMSETSHLISNESKDSLLRNMDLIMYVLYSGDEIFVMNMVRKVSSEVADKYNVQDIKHILKHDDKPMLYRCLFFLMLNFHKDFRYWVLSDESLGLRKICPYKATRFLLSLKNEIIPKFLMDEKVQLQELERNIKIYYIVS